MGTLRLLERVTGSDGNPSYFICTEPVVLQRYPVRLRFVHLGGVNGSAPPTQRARSEHPDFGCAVELRSGLGQPPQRSQAPYRLYHELWKHRFLKHEGERCGAVVWPQRNRAFGSAVLSLMLVSDGEKGRREEKVSASLLIDIATTTTITIIIVA